MAKKSTPETFTTTDWNAMVRDFHGESDRGSALLAAGFVDACLSQYLWTHCKDEELGRRLLDVRQQGLLSAFGAKMDAARFFGQLDPEAYSILRAIRTVRNHFAHHPRNATFDDEEVQKALAPFDDVVGQPDPEAASFTASVSRARFLLVCGFVVTYMQLT